MAKEIQFRVVTALTAEQNAQNKITKLIRCHVNLEVPDPKIAEQWIDDKKQLNKIGLIIQSYGLCQGILNNIHWGEKLDFITPMQHHQYVNYLLSNGLSKVKMHPTVKREK
jgi:hypothetical protein